MPRLKTSTIRARLLIGFVLMTLLPTIGVSVGTVAVSYISGRRQAIDRLESVAALKGQEVQEWIHALQSELVIASNTDLASERISVLLTLANDDRYYDFYHKAVRKRLQGLVQQSQQLEELFLLDVQGRVALSTDLSQEGRVYVDQRYFQQGLSGPYVQLPFDGANRDASFVLVAIPITGGEGQTLGVVAGRAPLETLSRMPRERTGAGRTGKSYLMDADHVVLPGLELPAVDVASDDGALALHSDGIDAAVDHRVGVSGIYADYRGTSVVGIYRWLPELNAALAVEQDLSEAFGAIFTIMAINLSIAVLAVLLAVVAALFIMRTIATPLVNLSDTATQIANGDLKQTAPVERDDEIGALAQAFNSMTAQLRDLIDRLEAAGRRARPRPSGRRALQLETSAQVSREVTSILDIDELLTQVVATDPRCLWLLPRPGLPGGPERRTDDPAGQQQRVSPATSVSCSWGKDSLNARPCKRARRCWSTTWRSDPDFLSDEQSARDSFGAGHPAAAGRPGHRHAGRAQHAGERLYARKTCWSSKAWAIRSPSPSRTRACTTEAASWQCCRSARAWPASCTTRSPSRCTAWSCSPRAGDGWPSAGARAHVRRLSDPDRRDRPAGAQRDAPADPRAAPAHAGAGGAGRRVAPAAGRCGEAGWHGSAHCRWTI